MAFILYLKKKHTYLICKLGIPDDLGVRYSKILEETTLRRKLTSPKFMILLYSWSYLFISCLCEINWFCRLSQIEPDFLLDRNKNIQIYRWCSQKEVTEKDYLTGIIKMFTKETHSWMRIKMIYKPYNFI